MKATWVMTDEEKQEKKEAALAKKRLKEISGKFSIFNFSEFVQLGLDALRM